MWQPVLMINGFIIFVWGALMLLPAAVLKYYTGAFDVTFIECSILSMFLGVVCPFICALPLYGNGDITSYADALFEATSGLTTTGSTILTDVEAQPKSVLFWRAILNGVSGVGIVIFAVALMPFLGIGGMHIFTKENSDTEEKFLPKVRYIAKDIIITYVLLNIICALLLKWAGMNWFDAICFAYVLLNIICALLLKWAGMNWFDAICFALATLCTGGLSTKNNSVAFFDSPTIEAIIGIFMLLGSLPMTYFILIAKKRSLTFITGNKQVNAFLKIVVFYILSITLIYAVSAQIDFTTAFRQVSFNVISAMTTTGLSSYDFIQWGGWVPVVFFILFLTGGCTGSTSGSVKIFRWQVIAAFFNKNATTSLSPNQVAVMKAGGKIIDDNIVASVFVMVLGFLFAIVFFTLVITITGVDFLTALGAVTGNITNSGLGLTEATGPAGSFASFTPFVKYLLAFIMVLGRLEVIAIFVLLHKIKVM